MNVLAQTNVANRRLALAASCGMLSLALWMLSFYNWHLPFYQNYMHMMCRFAGLTWRRYIWHSGPPRFTAIAAFVPLVSCGWYTAKAMLDQ